MLASVLVQIGWRSVFVWIGIAHLVLLPLLFALPGQGGAQSGGTPRESLSLREAARKRQFWLLLGDLRDLRARRLLRHDPRGGVRAGPRPRARCSAGHLLALMGLTGLVGVIAAGSASDRVGTGVGRRRRRSSRASSCSAGSRFDQSPVSIAVFALVFGATFLVTAPLTVVFVRESFGTKNLGALAGLITMVHQIFGGLGAYAGAAIFDATGGYDVAFVVMLVSAVVALALTLMLRRAGWRLTPA